MARLRYHQCLQGIYPLFCDLLASVCEQLSFEPMPIKQRSVVGKFDDVLKRLIARLGEDNVYRTDEDGTINSLPMVRDCG